jgi:hypothetical protein
MSDAEITSVLDDEATSSLRRYSSQPHDDPGYAHNDSVKATNGQNPAIAIKPAGPW